MPKINSCSRIIGLRSSPPRNLLGKIDASAQGNDQATSTYIAQVLYELVRPGKVTREVATAPRVTV